MHVHAIRSEALEERAALAERAGEALRAARMLQATTLMEEVGRLSLMKGRELLWRTQLLLESMDGDLAAEELETEIAMPLMFHLMGDEREFKFRARRKLVSTRRRERDGIVAAC